MIRAIIQAGFGNQLFQYATCYSLAKELGQKLQLDISFFDDFNRKERDNGRINNLDKLNIDSCSVINFPKSYWLYRLKQKLPFLRFSFVDGRLVPLVCEDIPNCREYQSHLFKGIGKRGAAVLGFWQNTKYFDKYILELKRQFTPGYQLGDEVLQLHDVIDSEQSVGVHIRRGDFVKLGWSKGTEYYNKGMDFLRKNLDKPHFYIVTDDVDWAQNQYKNVDDATIINVHTTNKDIDEFFLLSTCRHQIISESTFGWWAAYLNTNKEKYVIVPKTAKGQIFNNKEWIKI